MISMQERARPSEPVRELFAGECQSCGLCCIRYFYQPFNVAVELDPTRPEPPKKLVQIGPRRYGLNRYMRRVPIDIPKWEGFGKCVALELNVSNPNPNRGWEVRCTIYDSRPKCCSDFEPGSGACQAVRSWARMGPPAGLMDLGRS